MTRFVICLFTGLTLLGCSKKNYLPDTLPACIQEKINALKEAPKSNPPAQVDAYLYHGEVVYGFNRPCCDQYYEVYDKDCNFICAPSGGITGKGDGKCANFYKDAELLQTIYKDER
jgi:hypothetical protein